MKIGIDASDITSQKAGIGYFSYELTKALLLLDKENTYILFTHNKNYLGEFINYKNVIIKEFKAKSPNFFWILKVSLFARRNKLNLIISPSYFSLGILFSKTIQIIHDLAPIYWSQFWPKNSARMFKLQLKIASLRTKKFATISHYTMKLLNKTFPTTQNKSFYIGIGLNEWTKNVSTLEQVNKIKTKYNLPKQYVLSISTLQPRKNYINAIKAFKIFLRDNPDYYYVIGGKKGWYFEEIFQVVKECELTNKVIFLDYVPHEDLPVIYDCASSLIYISFEEGAGLPPLEAYSRGISVVASDIEVHKEVMQNHAIYVDPNNPNDIAKGIENSILIHPLVDKDFLDEFTWIKVAKRLQKIYKDFS